MSSMETSYPAASVDGSAERRKAWFYVTFAAVVVVLDVVTKYIVERTLPLYEPIPVIGDFFRLTYIFNRGAAFGLSLGEQSRWIFLGLTLVALVVLFLWFRTTHPADRLRLIAISSITGGAIGNLVDRVRSQRGVVDFLDVGFGDVRWPVFNVADIGVTVGAVMLAISLWKEEQEAGKDAG